MRVTVNGQTCLFSGEIVPTDVNGQCVNLAGEGSVASCSGGTLGEGEDDEDDDETIETPGTLN